MFENGIPLPLLLVITAVIAYFCGCFNAPSRGLTPSAFFSWR